MIVPMSVSTLTQKLAELSRRLTGLDEDSEEYDVLYNEICDVEDELEELANPRDKQDFA